MTPKEFSEITSHAWQYVLSPFRRPVPRRTYATERSLLSSKAFRWGNGVNLPKSSGMCWGSRWQSRAL
jgi:hypothetical protein